MRSPEVRNICKRMESMGYSQRQVSSAVGVSRTTLWRWSKAPKPNIAARRLLTVEQQISACDYACKHPQVIQKDLQQWIKEQYGVEVSQPYVSKLLKRHKVTRKKATKMYCEQNASKVRKFLHTLCQASMTK